MESCTANIIFRVILILALSVTCGHAAGNPDGLRLTHDLHVTLDPARHRLKANDRIVIKGHKGRRISFGLWPGMVVDQVRVNGKPGRYRFKDGRLSLPSASSSEDLQIEMIYHGRYDDPAPVQPLNTDNPGYGVTGTIQESGTMLLAGAGWYPDGHGRQVFNLSVDAPQGVLAVTSGTPLGHTTAGGRTLSRWLVEAPLRGMSLVAGRYTVQTRDFGGLTAATYFSDALSGLSDSYLEATGRYLKMYTELFGPYAFGQFAVVENFFPTGYGFPGFTLMGRRVLRLPFIIHTSLGHEIAHCWWGNGVRVDPSQGNWSEGLTTYVADYLYKERAGKGRARRQQWLRDYASLVDAGNESALTNFMSRADPATKALGYDKAAMVFHMLRRHVGDAEFWASLKEIYARHRFEAIAWSDIKTVFEQRSGLSLDRFFRQWVHRPGAPELSLANVDARPVSGAYVIQGKIVQKAPYYDLKIEMVVQTAGEAFRRVIETNGKVTPFDITVKAEPRELTLDPDVDLFRRIAPREIPATVNRLKGSKSVKIVVADELGSQAVPLGRRLAAAMGLDTARVGMRGEFTERDLADTDLVFVGLPDDRRWWAAAGEEFSVDRQRIRLLGKEYPIGNSSFFGVFGNARHPGRIAAGFVPGDAAFAASVSRKIPHYGKYSYLLFSKALNKVKGTWPVHDSPLKVRWNPGAVLITKGDGQ